MLNLPSSGYSTGSSQRNDASSLPQIDLLSLLRMCYRQWPSLLLALGSVFFIGTLYMVLATPKYTATFVIMVDTRKSQVLAKQEVSGDRQLDPGLVDSQVEILKSDSVALQVVRDLKLANDPDFLSPPGFLSKIISFGRGAAPPSQDDLEKSAVDVLTSAIKAKRVGVTYVIEVSYTGKNAEKAAAIANGIADAYMVGELEARFQATRRASRWLEDRIKELREQSNAADLAVQRYKAENNIVDTSRGLMSEQQLSDVNAQLIAARAATAEAKARYERGVEVSSGDVVTGTVADALRNEVITRLRSQYLDLSAREANFSSRFGKDHRAVLDLQRQMGEIERSIREEIQRITESAKSDLEIAQAREKSLSTDLGKLVSQAGVSGQAQVKLRDLESTALSYRNLYDTFLQKFQETTQEQTFPVINARVITPATVPGKPSAPRAIYVYAGCLVLGLVLGFAAVLIRELMGNNFRTPEDVNTYAGLECLGILPRLSNEVTRAITIDGVSDNVLGATSPVARYVISAPFSRFTETIRNVKVSIDVAKAGSEGGTVIGITSAVPSEGKTTFSANLALLTAQMGHKVLLIDGDMHSPSLTRTLRPGLAEGLMDVLAGRIALTKIISRDASTGLDFLGNVVTERHANTMTFLTSPQMKSLLASAKRTYDYIFVDLPPVVPVVDVKASLGLFDHHVFVIEWANTSRDVVRDAMLSVETNRQSFIGAILNKADPSELKRLESYRGSAYGSYYIETSSA